jgi:RHS repeat-associated protein
VYRPVHIPAYALKLYEECCPFGTSAYRAVDSSIAVSAKRYRYTGKERDEETGLDHMGARYYAAWLGRWTSADPIGLGDGVNRFAYVSGNPVGMRDPSGTFGEPNEQERSAHQQAEQADRELQPDGRLYPESSAIDVAVPVQEGPPTRAEIRALVSRTKADVDTGVLTRAEGEGLLSDIGSRANEAIGRSDPQLTRARRASIEGQSAIDALGTDQARHPVGEAYAQGVEIAISIGEVWGLVKAGLALGRALGRRAFGQSAKGGTRALGPKGGGGMGGVPHRSSATPLSAAERAAAASELKILEGAVEPLTNLIKSERATLQKAVTRFDKAQGGLRKAQAHVAELRAEGIEPGLESLGKVRSAKLVLQTRTTELETASASVTRLENIRDDVSRAVSDLTEQLRR